MSLLRGALALSLLGASFANPSPAHAGSDDLGALTGHVQCPDGRRVDVVLIQNGRRIDSTPVESDGTFMLSGVPAGQYTLLVRGAYCDRLELPVSVGAGAVYSIDVDLRCPPIPCQKLDKSDPGCILQYPEERAKVGSACQVHPNRRLRLDVVPIHYGFVGHPAGHDHRFPNARVVYSSGCVVGPERWAEVAYCPDCRAAFYWRNPQYVLHPIQPLDIREAKPRK